MTPTISKELQEQIEREAEDFKIEPHYRDGSALSAAPQIYLKRGYIAGATSYAHYKERWEQAKKVLEDVLALIPRTDSTRWLRYQTTITDAETLLASWKEEGKGG